MASRRAPGTRDPWRIYKRPPSIVLGFHGCDRAVGKALLVGDKTHLESSRNAYDWLGGGIYFLDKIVIDTMHDLRRDANEPPFDSVRAAFFEGPSLYEGSGFRRRNHIQLAIRNPECIKGYFRLPEL